MGNRKEDFRKGTVGDCFGGYASYICNVAPAKPSSAYTEEIKEKFLFATSQKSKPLRRNDECVVSNHINLTNKIVGMLK
ncbi:hypothetical protein K8R30_00100 [archaeon]|nr:hypothetical protein [archaeon]